MKRLDADMFPAASIENAMGLTQRAHVILWSTVLFFIVAGVWMAYAEIDQVTSGFGKVIPSGHVQVIQNLEGGLVSEIMVTEGQRVRKGEVLMKIDNTSAESSYQENELRLRALEAKASRLRAEAVGRPFDASEVALPESDPVVQRERELYSSRQQELETRRRILEQQVSQKRDELARLQAQLRKLSGSYELARRELQMTEPLLQEGAISEVELLRLRRQVRELRGDMESTRHAIDKAEGELQEALTKMEEAELKFQNEAREQLNDVESQIAALRETNLSLADRVTRTTVRSPVRGTVKQIMVNTVGGVIKPGQDLMEIVPIEEGLLVEAQIKPADIAFLHPGQDAVVKFSAYEYSTYGGIPGKLTHISADTIVDEKGEAYYLVRVQTEKAYLRHAGEQLPIIPGMTADVDILTGKRTILGYLLNPILRVQSEALRER